MDASPLMQSGNVLLPSDAPWISDYLSEFAAFPSGTNDDQVDPTMDAIKDILSVRKIDYKDLL
jgi:predicted phage terminase large subunit-like protein